MHFAELDRHDFRIYAGALEAEGGYIAGVAVRRIRGSARPEAAEIFHDDRLACGHRWASPRAALRYAVSKGVEVVDGLKDRIDVEQSEAFLRAAAAH